MTYVLTLSDEQAEILVSALDCYARIGLGQFEEVVDVYDRQMRLPTPERHHLREVLQHAKVVAGHPVNGSFGIHNNAVSDKFRAAYDIKQVVRHRLAWDKNPQGSIGVAFDTPRQISQLPLPAIEKHDHEQP